MTWAPPKEKHTVVADAFDHSIIDALAEETPVVSGYKEKLAVDFPYADELTRDLGSLLFKPTPEVREESDVDPRVMAARALVKAAWGVPEMDKLREYTVYDRWATATAMGAIQEALAPLMEELKEESKKAEAAAEDAEEAQRRLDEGEPGAERDLEGAVQRLGDLSRNVDGLRATAATLVRRNMERTADDLEETAEVAAGWGIGRAELETMSFEEREQLSKAFDTSRVRDYLKLIGRMKFELQSAQARRTDDGRDEAYSILLTGDLSEALPQELAALSDPDTELETLLRLAEGALLGRRWRGLQKSARGPIVTVIDNSGSMAGDREAFAKAVAIALMEAARADDRPYATIQFATHTSTILGCDWKAAMRVGSEFLNGGTDYCLALDEALGFIEEQDGFDRADIILIGDGEFPIPPSWLKKYVARRHDSGVRAWGVSVGGYDDSVFHQTCDNVRRISDLTSPSSMTDLFAAV